MPEVIFNGPDGRLEGRYHKSKQADAPIAIVLHPHPLHGGNMNNRIVYIMYNAFVERGFSVLPWPPRTPIVALHFAGRSLVLPLGS